MKRRYFRAAWLVAALACHPGTGAADSTISFTGYVGTPICTLAAAGLNQQVALTPVDADALLAGATAQPTIFAFELTNCSSQYVQVSLTLGGTTDASDTAYARVIHTLGTATNVGIGLRL